MFMDGRIKWPEMAPTEAGNLSFFMAWGGDDDVNVGGPCYEIGFSQYRAESLNISMRMNWPAFVFGMCMWEKLQ